MTQTTIDEKAVEEANKLEQYTNDLKDAEHQHPMEIPEDAAG